MKKVVDFQSLMKRKIDYFDFHVKNLKNYTVNIYRYKAIGANATSSVILYTGKCISPCL